MKPKFFTFAFALAALICSVSLGSTPPRMSDEECDQACRKDLAAARAGTADYHEFPVALSDAFVPVGPCVALPSGETMGFHYRKESRVDQILDPAEPEILLYLPNEDGEMQLVAVEYIVPYTGSSFVPELFGQQMHYNAGRNRYELHAWIWRHNPDGMFADYNPRLRCPAL